MRPWRSDGEFVKVQLQLYGTWDPTQFTLGFYMATLKGERLRWMDNAGHPVAHSIVLQGISFGRGRNGIDLHEAFP